MFSPGEDSFQLTLYCFDYTDFPEKILTYVNFEHKSHLF